MRTIEICRKCEQPVDDFCAANSCPESGEKFALVPLAALAGDSFKPDWRVHPGGTLRETLRERGMSQSYLAWATGYTQKHVNRVVKGHNAISATMAVRLEDVLGTPSAEFWMTYQMIYDLHAVREMERGW